LKLPHYDDILSRIAEPPRWFVEHSVPPYCDFAPHRIANIYARECALFANECQNCRRPFIVALDERAANNNVISRPGYEPPWRTLADIIRSHEIQYRDPPNVERCPVGASMTSTPRGMLEYWKRIQETYTTSARGILVTGGPRDWQRDHSLEIEIPDAGEWMLAHPAAPDRAREGSRVLSQQGERD
jgi:hypothetical protein